MANPDRDDASFVASIPYKIQAHWNPRYAHLAGFPLNIAFSGMRAASEGEDGPAHRAVSFYWFDPGTYAEDEQTRKMEYFAREEGPYSVRVVSNRATGAWQIFKYKRDTLIGEAIGTDFDGAMIHASLIGLEADEPESSGEPPGA